MVAGLVPQPPRMLRSGWRGCWFRCSGGFPSLRPGVGVFLGLGIVAGQVVFVRNLFEFNEEERSSPQQGNDTKDDENNHDVEPAFIAARDR